MSDTQIKIPAELFAPAESSHFEGTLVLPEISLGSDVYKFAEPIEWSVQITNTGSALLVQGSAKGDAVVACARCLEDVPYSFDGEIEGFYLLDPEDMQDFEEAEDAPGEDEFELLPGDHIIDLEELIKAALILEMPQQPLCDLDCAGLCPACGANLNKGECGCGGQSDVQEFDRESNPFAVLADIDFSEN